jgi:[ribosomal protein S5]-alanine N-acetyltransferase
VGRASLPTIALGLPGYTLRAWATADAPALAEHANNRAVWRNMSDTFPHPYTLGIAQHWVDGGHIEFGGDNWAVAFNGEAVGGCGIVQEPGKFRCNAEIGYWLAQAHWGKGVGTHVADALARTALATADVTRAYALIHAYNPASQRVCEKAGFTREGLLRLSAFKDGEVIDRVVWAAYKDTWASKLSPATGCA